GHRAVRPSRLRANQTAGRGVAPGGARRRRQAHPADPAIERGVARAIGLPGEQPAAEGRTAQAMDLARFDLERRPGLGSQGLDRSDETEIAEPESMVRRFAFPDRGGESRERQGAARESFEDLPLGAREPAPRFGQLLEPTARGGGEKRQRSEILFESQAVELAEVGRAVRLVDRARDLDLPRLDRPKLRPEGGELRGSELAEAREALDLRVVPDKDQQDVVRALPGARRESVEKLDQD